MFRRITIICSSVLLLVSFIWIFHLWIVRQEDFNLYISLRQQKEIASSKSPYSSTAQHRKKVRKDIWFAQDTGSRLHYRIESASSVLSIIPIGNKFEVIESLEGIRCLMQDKLYHSSNTQPMQQARLIEAKEGTYQYASQELIAKEVVLSLFRLIGHALPLQLLDTQKAFLKGNASNVSFKIAGKSPQFQAQEFKALMVKNDVE